MRQGPAISRRVAMQVATARQMVRTEHSSLHYWLLLGAVFLALLLARSARADGMVIIREPRVVVPGHFAFAPLAVSYHRVAVAIKDLVASTTVEEEFFNPNDAQLEGTYIFPLPAGAHIDKFAMDINGTMMEAELLPADKARAIYEDVVRKLKDPALLEYVGRDAFKVRIFPIEPHSRKQVKITYTELLKDDHGLVEYSYPLNTEKFSSAPVKQVAVTVTLTGKTALKNIYCPSHPVEIKRTSETEARVSYEASDARPDTDFKVIFSRQANPLGVDLLCSRAAGADGTFMLLVSPGLAAPATKPQPKDLCFVLDTSGSMAGAKLEQAKKALRFCLANLNAGDHFEIIRFSSEAEPRFNRLVPADARHLAWAEEFIAGLKPIGGTAIGEAMGKALALAQDRGPEPRPYVVIFLTDGLPTVGETSEESLVKMARNSNHSGTRIFTFGIGTDVNTHLLDRVASDSRALSQYVLPTEDLEVKLSNFFSKIKDPLLVNPVLAFTNPAIQVEQLYPRDLPDLYSGDMLVLFGRYRGQGPAAVKLTGTYNGQPYTFTADVTFAATAAGNDYIPQLWATRRVGWLLNEIRLHGESAELKDEVVRLARAYSIVTPYTAYLIIEDERSRGVPVALRNFQELERDEAHFRKVERESKSLGVEALTPGVRSGAGAVDNALALNDLAQKADRGDVTKSAGAERLWKTGPVPASTAMPARPLSSGAPPADAAPSFGYRASQTQNYAQQSRLVNGRAFFQNGNIWTDATAQAQKALKQQAIAFNSDAYFALQRQYPHALPWFALGANVDVVIDDTLYQIREPKS